MRLACFSMFAGYILLTGKVALADGLFSLAAVHERTIPPQSVSAAELRDLSAKGISTDQPPSGAGRVRVSVILWDEVSRRKPSRPATPPVNNATASSVTIGTPP